MRKRIIALVLFAQAFTSNIGWASSDPEISGENHGGEPVVGVTDDSVNAGLEDWQEENRRAAEEKRRKIEENNRKIRELRQWLADRKPIHDKLVNDIQSLQREAEAVRESNAERHRHLEAEISRTQEEVAHLNDEFKPVKTDLVEKLGHYEKLRGSIPWGTGEGSDQAKFEKAASEFSTHREYSFGTSISSEEGKNLAQALAYRNWVAEQLDPSADGFGKQAFAVSAADRTLDIADESYGKGESVEGDFATEAAKSMLDLALGLTPGVSWGKDIFEAVNGKNLVTGHDLDMFERSMAVLGAATVGVGSTVGKAVKALNVFKKLETAGGALKYAAEFDARSVGRMRGGKPPNTSKTQYHQGRQKYELHHIHPINQGGSVYDSSNIMITTPRFHSEVLTREYNGLRS